MSRTASYGTYLALRPSTAHSGKTGIATHPSGCTYNTAEGMQMLWEGSVILVNKITTHTLHHAATGLQGSMAPHMQVQVIVNTSQPTLYLSVSNGVPVLRGVRKHVNSQSSPRVAIHYEWLVFCSKSKYQPNSPLQHLKGVPTLLKPLSVATAIVHTQSPPRHRHS